MPVVGGGYAEMSYDVDNRLRTWRGPASQIEEEYGYLADNKRVWKKTPAGAETYYLYGVGGQRLMTCSIVASPFSLICSMTHVYFGGKLIRADGDPVVHDRLGSVVARGNAYGSGVVTKRDHFPYGDEIGGATSGNVDKFGTYTRDATTGLDYADQRYYAGTLGGRFLTADPYEASGGTSEPGSWNRYPYVGGDPVNANDPGGLAVCWVNQWYREGSGPWQAQMKCRSDDSTQHSSEWTPAPAWLSPYDDLANVLMSTAALDTTGVSLDTMAAEGILANARFDFGQAVDRGLFGKPCVDAIGSITTLPLPGEISGQSITVSQLWDNFRSWNLTPMESSNKAGYFAARPTVTAEVDHSTKTVYVNSRRAQSLGFEGMIGLLVHEAIHALTGYGDAAIQEALALPAVDANGVAVSSDNITNKFAALCGVGLRGRL
jgi:RHS repeat-associated protein